MVQAKWQVLSAKAASIRDNSMAEIEKYFPSPPGAKHFDPLPNPLPLNVTGLQKVYLTASDYEIIETEPIELLAKLASKQVSAVEVAGAYLRASVVAQRTINCITEFLPQKAFEKASYLDRYLEENGKTVGPFHGLPISVKEMVPFKGLTCNFSFTCKVENISGHEALILEVLGNAGAVFHVRTTQPQLLMHLECESNVHGLTVNPFNRNLTSGGSSGGEGALLGMHGSCLGIGTDIGGSIRCPASLQGQYGMRPTTRRLPIGDNYHAMMGAEAIPGSIGPMARSLKAAELMFKTILDAEPWRKDLTLSPAPFNENIAKGKKTLRIGVLSDDGVVKPLPTVARAIQEVVTALKTQGNTEDFDVELVTFEPYKHDEAWRIISSLYFEDGGREDLEGLASTDEPILPLTKWILTENPNVKEISVPELWELNVQKYQYMSEYLDHWNNSKIDLLLCPVGPGPAPTHGNSKYWGYTAQWNLLDYPSITFPVTTVDQVKDVVDTSYIPRNDTDAFVQSIYTPEQYTDAPVCLQLVAIRNQDELIFHGMNVIEKALGRA